VRSALAVVLVAVLGAAASDEPAAEHALARAVEESRSGDAEVRARAIRRLGDFSGPTITDALQHILLETDPVPDTRERGWLEAAHALARIAKRESLRADVLERLAVLAAARPTVLAEQRVDRGERTRHTTLVPRYDFAHAAARALAAHREGEIERRLAREIGALAPERRVEALSAIAWNDARTYEERTRRELARNLLREQGSAAGAAAVAAISSASPEIQLDLLHFFGAFCDRGRTSDCHAGLLALAAAKRSDVWVHAYERLGRLGTPEAAAAVIESIEGLDTENPRRFRVGLVALGELHQPGTLSDLIALLDHRDEKIGAAAARAIVRFGAEGRRALLEAGASESARVRAAVYAGMREYGEDVEITFALRMLAPPDGDSGELLRGDREIRGARAAVLDELAARPDPAALFGLARLSEATFPHPHEREETWTRLARAVHAIVDGKAGTASAPSVPEELVAFLRAIATSAPQATYQRPTDHPPRDRRYAYREWAQSALVEIDLAEACRALSAELATSGPDLAATLAWSGEHCRELRCQAARRILLERGNEGLRQSRPWLQRASAGNRFEMVGHLQTAYRNDRAGAAADLLVLADAEEPAVWQQAHAALRALRPEGVAAPLVRQLERRDETARTRAGLETLGALGDPAAWIFVRRHILSDDEAVSLAAARALARLGESGKRWLVTSLTELPERAQRSAALALADLDEPAAHEALVRFSAATPDAGLRRELLAKLRAGEAEPPRTFP
jgi:hypothetical protein